MKNLLSKKWFRRLCQTLFAIVSLAVLLTVIINWYGAKLRRDTLAQIRAQGQPVTLAEMVRPMPPEKENFAMIPILAQARDQWMQDPVMNSAEKPDEARVRLKSMVMNEGSGRGSFYRNEEPDFSKWKTGLKLEGDPAQCLAEYDRRSADVLAELREGLSRPETVSPMLQLLQGRNDSSQLSAGFIFSLGKLSAAMNFRAELALAAGRPDIAYESVMISMRLVESIGAEDLLISALYQNSVLQWLPQTLGRGLEKGGWSEEQIAAIRLRFAGWNTLERYRRGLDVEIINSFSIYDAFRENRSVWVDASQPNIFKVAGNLVPTGWFDRNAALLARSELGFRKDLGQGDDLAHWLEACRNALRHSPASSFWTHPMMEWNMGNSFENACRGVVVTRQAMLACELEIHRLKSGSYPADLAQLPGETKIDPLTGGLFHYRPEGKGFALYSSGPDLKDDGGKIMKKGRNPDLVW